MLQLPEKGQGTEERGESRTGYVSSSLSTGERWVLLASPADRLLGPWQICAKSPTLSPGAGGIKDIRLNKLFLERKILKVNELRNLKVGIQVSIAVD